MSEKKVTKEISLYDYNSARRSIQGRLDRLRTVPRDWRFMSDGEEMQSPIQRLGVFEDEISKVEKEYEKIQARLDNAKITIEI